MRTRGKRAPAALSVAVLLALLMGLTGCTTASGGPTGALSRALDQCSSATASVELSFNLLIKGKATTAVAATTAEDMGKEILTAQKQVTTLKADTDNDRRQQSDALDLVNITTKTLISAQQALADNDTGAIGVAAQELKSRTLELTSMSGHLKAQK